MTDSKPLSSEKPAPWQQAGFVVAVLITLWAVALHVVNLFNAGPLWRDEIGTVDFAAMPSLAGIWRNLRYDNFPPLFVALARLWTLAGLTSDFSYRLLGFLVGMGTLGAFWWCAKRMGGRAPLLGLALYAVNPMAIRVGDALRPYGLGIVLTVLTLALVWNFVQAPGWKTFFWAALAAMLSVQSLYQNAFFIVAFCCGAWVVALGRREWKTAWQTGLIGLIAAISLLPYLEIIGKGEEWRVISRERNNFDAIWASLRAALQTSGGWMAVVWLALLAAALVAGVGYGMRRKRWGMAYGGVVLLVSVVINVLFLRFLNEPPRLWYFLTLMASAALILDSVFGGLDMGWAQNGRAGISCIIVLACMPACYPPVALRQSNIDLVAAKLKEVAQTNDCIVVTPWYYGVSLQRYFDTNRWTTVPPMAELRIHRYDLLRQEMEKEDPIGPLLDKAGATLLAGHNLWVVGGLEKPPNRNPPAVLPPYNQSILEGEDVYCSSWELQLAHLVDMHAAGVHFVKIPVPGGQQVNFFENVPLMVVQGWHE